MATYGGPPVRMVANLETAVDTVLKEALSKISVADADVTDDNHVDVKFTVDVWVRGDVATDAIGEGGGLDPNKTVGEAMGAICCRWWKYQNGSWVCNGTCC